ncbi:hypothetical protein KBC75_03880 [Candidatus Shapirobacteria bacterium]|nr:hypothetical protein [Candidatus Shapirobacteria bacterium]
MRTTKPSNISDSLSLFKDTLIKRKKYIKNEFQSYALDLAKELDDWSHKTIYLRLAKNVDRELLEKAKYFVKDHNPGAVQSKGGLFMWKLKQLRAEKKFKNKL